MVGRQTFEFGREPFFDALQFLHEPRSALAPLFANRLFDFVNLILDEPAPGFDRNGNLLKARMRHDHAIPIPRRDAAEKPRPFRRRDNVPYLASPRFLTRGLPVWWLENLSICACDHFNFVQQ